MVPVPGRKGDPPMWRFPMWRDDGLELVPTYAEVGTGFVRWEMRFHGEALGELLGLSLVVTVQADKLQPEPMVRVVTWA